MVITWPRKIKNDKERLENSEDSCKMAKMAKKQL